jgi:N-acetylglucosamine kinase-like BadF-type ATPase
MAFVLGVDAGGTKTLAALADEGGTVRGVGLGGSANYQGCGLRGAEQQLARALAAAATAAGARLDALAAAAYGVSGADRPKDFALIRGSLERLAPCPRLRLENDTLVALRAGTLDGVGIALIAGTGSNAIGRNAQGQTLQVGGLGRWSGDHGSAGQLGEAALVAAFMGQDGRGPPTSLGPRICQALGLERLEDVIEFGFYDLERGPLDTGTLAPLLFAAAAEGDPVARALLQQAGLEVARATKVLLARLFPGGEEVSVVFGGSVFQRGADPTLIDTVAAETRAARPATRFVRLEDEPVLGAVQFAFDDAGWPVTPRVAARLRSSFADGLARARAQEAPA